MYTASCHCGWTSRPYGTQQAADDALARHQRYAGH